MSTKVKAFSAQLTVFVAALLLSFSSAFAKPGTNEWGHGGNFGLGLMLGDPSAITGRYTMNEQTAFQAGLSFFYSNWTHITVDWLHLFEHGFGKQNEFLSETTPYIGAGLVAVISSLDRGASRRTRYFDTSDSNLALGIRVPFGAEWRAPRFPVGVFAEIAPGLTILPGTYAFIQLGIGARYYF